MITRFLLAIRNGALYVRQHPHIFFVLVLMAVIPVLFLLVADQFLQAGRENQDRLQKDRIGLMQDSFVAMMWANQYQAEKLQPIVESIAAVNPDITKFRIARRDEGDIVPVVSLDPSVRGKKEDEEEFYRTAAISHDESIIVTFYIDGDRFWQVFRYVGFANGHDWFIFTELSLANIDAAMAKRERDAYFLLVPIFVFIFFMAYWQFKNTDYRYLYLKAEEANKTRDLFTNMITHELRAPLTAMRGYASLIEENQAAIPQSKEHASRIRESTERLLMIVNDLLEVARIQSGRLKIDFTEVNLSDLIQSVIVELEPTAVQKNITVAHAGTEAPLYIISDANRLHQILVNLVNNAIKYTPQGRIDVTLTKLNHGVELRVKDTGMGISAEDQQNLFAPFFRVETEEVGKITGTGLGMWITKQLIELLGGTVGIESIKGVGTNVVMRFPGTPPTPKSN